MTHDEAVKAFADNVAVHELLWGKKFDQAIYFTAPYVGGIVMVNLKTGYVNLSDPFTNEEELARVIANILL